MFSPFTWCFYNAVDDGYESFAVVSEYFGRSLFNKLTVVTKPPEVSQPLPTSAPALQSYGQSEEVKLRLQEGQSEQVLKVSDSRTHQRQHSSNFENIVTKFEPQVHTKRSTFAESSDVNKSNHQPKLSPVANYSTNPFEETYDESKNPFADETMSDPTNPFTDDDDYDENLNPFS